MDLYAVQETWREGSGVETSALTRNIRSGSPAAAGESCEREVGRRLGARQPKMSISSKSCLRGWRLVLLLAAITNSVQFRIARTARLIIW